MNYNLELNPVGIYIKVNSKCFEYAYKLLNFNKIINAFDENKMQKFYTIRKNLEIF